MEITLPNSQADQSFRSIAGKRSNGRAVYLGDPRLALLGRSPIGVEKSALTTPCPVAAGSAFSGKVQRIVNGLKFGGHKANIVTYAMAWIAHRLKAGVDLQRIWDYQGIDEQLSEIITAICPGVYKLIIDSDGRNVGEWCKSELCWSRIRISDLKLPTHWMRVIEGRLDEAAAIRDRPAPVEGGHVIERVTLLGGDTWTALAQWARETGDLDEGQRALAMSIGRAIGSGKGVSVKRAVDAERMLEEAIRKGFRYRTLVVA